MPLGNHVHMYHLQRWRGSAPAGADPGLQDWLGHAVTSDLIDWEERPAAFGPDSGNPQDDLQPWTGCAVWHRERAHLFYTMRGSANGGRIQAIGAAVGDTPDQFVRIAINPVLIPDSCWAATAESPVPGLRDCRDLQIVPDPNGGGFFGFYATRRPGGELPMTSAIAVCYSDDLRHWEQRGLAFTPERHACVEVPDVFTLNGRWYMTCLTGNFYGNRGGLSDPHLANGTIYAVADRPEGPYVELADNVLTGARTTAVLSLRSFEFEGQRYVLYTDREREGYSDSGAVTFGTMTTPKILQTSGDRLVMAYSPRIERKVCRELIGASAPAVHHEGPLWGQLWPMATARWEWGDTIRGNSQTGWGVAPLGCGAEGYILEADVNLQEGTVAAGFAVRFAHSRAFAVVGVDVRAQTVMYADAPEFDFLEQRQTPVARDTWMHLRVVNRREHIEVYLNDELRLAFSRYRGIGGEVGLWIDRGRARFRNIRMREISLLPRAE